MSKLSDGYLSLGLVYGFGEEESHRHFEDIVEIAQNYKQIPH